MAIPLLDVGTGLELPPSLASLSPIPKKSSAFILTRFGGAVASCSICNC